MAQLSRDEGMLIFLLHFLFTQYLNYCSEHRICILKMPFSEFPFGRDSWAVYPVSDELHHTLQTRSGSTWIERCPGSLAQGWHGTGRALPHHVPAWTQIKFSHFLVAESPC